MLFMIKWPFVELSVSACAVLHNTLVRPLLECAMHASSLNLVSDADCLEQIQRVGNEARKGFPPTAT